MYSEPSLYSNSEEVGTRMFLHPTQEPLSPKCWLQVLKQMFLLFLSFHIVPPVLRIYFRTAVNSTRRILNVTKVAQ